MANLIEFNETKLRLIIKEEIEVQLSLFTARIESKIEKILHSKTPALSTEEQLKRDQWNLTYPGLLDTLEKPHTERKSAEEWLKIFAEIKACGSRSQVAKKHDLNYFSLCATLNWFFNRANQFKEIPIPHELDCLKGAKRPGRAKGSKNKPKLNLESEEQNPLDINEINSSDDILKPKIPKEHPVITKTCSVCLQSFKTKAYKAVKCPICSEKNGQSHFKEIIPKSSELTDPIENSNQNDGSAGSQTNIIKSYNVDSDAIEVKFKAGTLQTRPMKKEEVEVK